MFRYERMQHGRYRQFSQIGLEIIGADTPLADAELLAAMHEFFLRLGFSDLQIHLNNLGDPEDRARYQDAIRAALMPRRAELCADCQRRLEENPLRILDCKVPACQVIAADAPGVDDVAGEPSRQHVAQVEAHLEALGIPYLRNRRLVRGLDYYLRTVFEVVSPQLGTNTVLCGGGRYDRLIADLGGPAVPGVGFAIGEDRLVEALPAPFKEAVLSRAALYVVPLGATAQGRVLELARGWIREGVPVELEITGRSLKAALKKADRDGFRAVAMLGDDELNAKTVTVRDLAAGSQTPVPFADLPAWWRTLLPVSEPVGGE
jgi:histidyl-tRNA synthetase